MKLARYVIAVAIVACSSCGGGGGSSSSPVTATSMATPTPSPTPSFLPTAIPSAPLAFNVITLSGPASQPVIGNDLQVYAYASGSILRLSKSGIAKAFPVQFGPTIQLCSFAVARDGEIWSAPGGGNTAYRFDPNTGVQTTVTLPIGKNDGTACIASSADGTIWFWAVTSVSIGLVKVPPSGPATYMALPQQNLTVEAMARGGDGNLWFTANDKVSGAPFFGRVESTGSVSLFPYPKSNGLILAIVAGADGNTWYCDSNNALIGNVSLTGQFSSAYSIGSSGAFSCLGIAPGKSAGSYWVLDSFNGALIDWSQGSVQSRTRFPNAASGPNPVGLVMDQSGTLWTTEGNKTAIDMITVQ